MLQGLRYANAEYYWINDLETRLVMHPFLPGRIGEDMKGYQVESRARQLRELVTRFQVERSEPKPPLAPRERDGVRVSKPRG